ncbi:hypothetical protein ACVW0I_004074 [Bradyrhizobium sp. LM6.11]
MKMIGKLRPAGNQPGLQLIAGDDRHLDVGDHACRIVSWRLPQEVHAVFVGLRIIADRTHEARQRRANAFVVVHDRNHRGLGHGRTILTAVFRKESISLCAADEALCTRGSPAGIILRFGP